MKKIKTTHGHSHANKVFFRNFWYWYVKDVYWNCYGRSMPPKFPWRKWFIALIESENAEDNNGQ